MFILVLFLCGLNQAAYDAEFYVETSTLAEDLLHFISFAVFLAVPIGNFWSWWKNSPANLPSSRPKIIRLGPEKNTVREADARL
jgi:hypothetical protein